MKKIVIASLLVLNMIFVFTACSKNNNGFDLYSDSNKYVVNYNDEYKMVFYHDKDKITNVEYYYEFETKSTAENEGISIVKSIVNDDKAQISVKNKYVVVKLDPSNYKDLTLENVKSVYSNLQEVKKQ